MSEELYITSDHSINSGKWVLTCLARPKEEALAKLTREGGGYLYRLVPVARVRTETVVESIEE